MESNAIPGQAPYHSDEEDDTDGECCSCLVVFKLTLNLKGSIMTEGKGM